ncbi:unnamed protein product, partial [Amoebophrya sp. A25]
SVINGTRSQDGEDDATPRNKKQGDSDMEHAVCDGSAAASHKVGLVSSRVDSSGGKTDSNADSGRGRTLAEGSYNFNQRSAADGRKEKTKSMDILASANVMMSSSIASAASGDVIAQPEQKSASSVTRDSRVSARDPRRRRSKEPFSLSKQLSNDRTNGSSGTRHDHIYEDRRGSYALFDVIPGSNRGGEKRSFTNAPSSLPPS